MLIIDGVKYESWNPPNEDEFERIVKEHTKDIFSTDSIYLDIKQKLKSLSGIGSIPDGLAIILGEKPEWHIVEYELATHDVYGHIVSQVSKFINGLKNLKTQQAVSNAIYGEVIKDPILKLQIEKYIGSNEIYKFLFEMIASKAFLSIIINQKQPDLDEAIAPFQYSNIKGVNILEFMTFARQGVGITVHAHLFDALVAYATHTEVIEESARKSIFKDDSHQIKMGLSLLIDKGMLNPGQIIWGKFRNQRFEAMILNNGRIRLSNSGKEFNSLSMAAKEIVGYNINGWRWWKTTSNAGQECFLKDLGH